MTNSPKGIIAKVNTAQIGWKLIMNKAFNKERENLCFNKFKVKENLSTTGSNGILEVTGEALAEGVYVGTSGKFKFYPIDILKKFGSTFIGKPIIWDHEKDENGNPYAKAVVGKVTRVWFEGKKMMYDGEIYVKDAIDLISNGAISKVSAGMETDSEYNFELSKDAPSVFDLEFIELSLVVKSAYQDATIKPK